jgi:hypothetical protein
MAGFEVITYGRFWVTAEAEGAAASASAGGLFARAIAAAVADAPFRKPLRELSILISVLSLFCGGTAIVFAGFPAQKSTLRTACC